MVKLLVADQYPIITKGVELVFSDSRDVKIVATVSDGEAIFDVLNEYYVDIIMCDIDLPKLNGISVLRRLKKDTLTLKQLFFLDNKKMFMRLAPLKLAQMDLYLKQKTY